MRLEPGCKVGRERLLQLFEARDVDNITGELGDVGKIAHLSGEPWRRGMEKGVGERLMIGEKGKVTGFKEETEVMDGGVSCGSFIYQQRRHVLITFRFLKRSSSSP